MASLAITWLGHSTFLLRLPGGQRLVTDPWLGNPGCPTELSRPESLSPLDLILISHAHDDHASDAVALGRATGAVTVCGFELGQDLTARGLQSVRAMGIGGTQTVAGVTITMVQATHSSSTLRNGHPSSLGVAAGFVVRAPDLPTVYFAGDTGLFLDMKTIAELYRPEIAFLPIGDHFTMGPDTAAVAARWLNVRQVVPMHWGSHPLLTGTPAALRGALEQTGIDVLELAPGETAD
jgi:L-ascorbate metabolism protein UlaG (beta-lactamase superfamily)